MFVSERLVFRRPDWELDGPKFAAYGNDPFHVTAMTSGGCVPWTPDFMKKLFAERDHKSMPAFVIALKPSGPVNFKEIAAKTPMIGMLSIQDADTQKNRTVGLGIGFDPDQTGKGYGPEALRFALDYVFYELNMNRLVLQMRGDNAPAIKAYERVGFRHEGRFVQAMFKNGKFEDVLQMAMVRSEWEEKNPGAQKVGFSPMEITY